MITHRDPLRVIGSLADLMATLHYMHSDHVDHAVLVEFMAMGLEMQMDHVAAERDAGAVPEDQIADVVYQDLVADPVDVIERLYAGWDLPVSRRVPHRARGLPRRPPHAGGPAATTTPSPTRASTWPPTARWWRRTRSASACPPRSDGAPVGARAPGRTPRSRRGPAIFTTSAVGCGGPSASTQRTSM